MVNAANVFHVIFDSCSYYLKRYEVYQLRFLHYRYMYISMQWKMLSDTLHTGGHSLRDHSYPLHCCDYVHNHHLCTG